MIRILFTVLILLSAFSGSYAFELAELKTDTAEELLLFFEKEELVTATGTPKSVRTAPAVASVITARDIEEMGATTLDEALETVPGLHVYPSYGSFAPVYSIRGIQTSLNPQVLVLVNGLPITTLYNGRRIFGLRIPVSNISRIEVIRGPGSAVHGADAFSGTINVITKDGKEIDGLKTGMRVGSFETYGGWGQYGFNHEGWDVSLSLEYQESRGDKDRVVSKDFQTTLDTLTGTSASLAPGELRTRYKNLNGHVGLSKDNLTLRLWGSLGYDIGTGSGAAQALDDTDDVEYELLLSDLTYKNDHLIRDGEMNIRLSHLYQHSDTKFRILPPGALVTLDADGVLTFDPASARYLALFSEGYIGQPVQTDNIISIDYEAFYRGFNDHLVRFGTGYKYQKEDTEQYTNFGSEAIDLTSLSAPPDVNVISGNLTYSDDGPSIYLEDQKRDLWYLSLQDEWAFARAWELTAGMRYDHYSDFGETINPRAALVWGTLEYLTTKLLYGRAFRSPSFAEQHNQNNPVILGNPGLDPETINTWELAFDFHPTRTFRSKLNLFYYEIDGLIEYVLDPGGTTSTAQNAKDQEGRGFEIEADWKVTDTFRLSGNLAYQHSRDKETREIVPDAPELQFYFNPHWEFLPEWSVDAQYFRIAGRHRAEGDTRDNINDYNLVNLTLRRKNILKHLDFALAARNLFDEDVREPSNGLIPDDFPMEGQNIWAELRYHL
jgi:outer membrane receptor for ferrienterochelin and colicins